MIVHRTRTIFAAIGLTLTTVLTSEAQPQDRSFTRRAPAAPTVVGDTGLWFVPSAEVLPDRGWSLSSFRVNTDRQQGFTDISHFAGGGAYGIKNRLEIFGALNAQTRIDRDVRPLGISELPIPGGLDGDYPFARTGFTRGFGDLSLGAKYNLYSQQRGAPVALAVRSLVKLPTGEKSRGVTTGETDVIVDAVASRHFGGVEVAGFGGAIVRGDAPEVALTNGVRWGVGAGWPVPWRLRLVTEIRGEVALDDNVITPTPFVTGDGSLAPLHSLIRNPVDALVGVTWHAPSGVFVGAGLSWAARFHERERFGIPSATSSAIGDRIGLQFALGFRPGRRAVALPDATPPPVSVRQPRPPAPPTAEPPRVADAPPAALILEDVHFDFDRYTLRPSARRVLDEAVKAFEASPDLRITIDGHTCNIGTAEYNLALADRRAQVVRDYLIQQGVDPTRLSTAAYGEEQPHHDNGREESRRLNRRAALMVEIRDTTAAAQNQ